MLFRNDGLNLAADSPLAEEQLMAVECGLEYATLERLTPGDGQALVACYFDCVQSDHRWPVRQTRSTGPRFSAPHEGVGQTVEEGQRRLPLQCFGPTTDRRLLHRVEWCHLPGLGDLTVASVGDGTRQMLSELFYSME